ncbi:VTC domain-containing protein, partial [bacterium]|nr:VTC domain-containing protein [bacterium]
MANFHGRYELKYFLPYDLIDKAIEFASPYVQPDQHAKPNGLGVPGYTIRSVYFDDDNLTLYKEELIGLKDRRKFRVRGYANVTP